MEEASLGLKDSAFSMQSNARQLELEAKRRRIRLIIILGILGAAILLYIIVPLVSE
jgi:hypothetical protein